MFKNQIKKKYWDIGSLTNIKREVFLKAGHHHIHVFLQKKKVYDEFGNYNISLGNSSDFDLMFRFLEINKINSKHIDKMLVTMRYGGASNKNFRAILDQYFVILNILGINRNFFKIIFFMFFKFINRLKQFFNKVKR